ncbi:hypothetical protein LCGC14_1194910 [marine sediment metagenome]|uniref:Uncharacterized protein n=1 Tax=marine sediment metagenome TaxID=412755 RepID=A0A0F9LIN8_9ZZZZ
MKSCDILLIKRKYDPIGWIIQWATGGKYNHACIAVSKDHILDIRAKKIEEIVHKSRYLNDRFEVKLVRWFGFRKLQDMDMYVIRYICNQKKKYTYLSWLISIILILFKKKPLRSTCSGLIAEAFSILGINFNDNKEPYEISPEDINKCPNIIDVTKELYD